MGALICTSWSLKAPHVTANRGKQDVVGVLCRD